MNVGEEEREVQRMREQLSSSSTEKMQNCTNDERTAREVKTHKHNNKE